MKLISNISKVGYVLGAILITVSIIRYFIMWLDYSQAMLFIGLGISSIAFAWVYSRILSLQNSLLAVEEYLSDM